MFIQSIIAASAAPAVSTRPARAPEAQSASPAPAAPAADDAALRKMLDAANEALRASASSVQFSVEQESGRTVVLVVDEATHEVIRQIPSEEMMAIGREIERLQGLLMKGKA